MRRRNSVSSASGTFTRNGRKAVLLAACSLPRGVAMAWVMVSSCRRWFHQPTPRRRSPKTVTLTCELTCSPQRFRELGNRLDSSSTCHADRLRSVPGSRWRVYAGAVPPPAEATIGIALARPLLEEQHPDLAALPLIDAGEGWDNRTFRLGEDLAVRLPRRTASASLIEHEQRWLPLLAPHLPLPVPSPIRIGRAGCGFPWSWSVTRWLPGETALMSPFLDDHAAASDLAHFLRALHRPAPHDAPRNPWRGVPLGTRDALLREHLASTTGRVDQAAVIETWERLRATPPWTGAAMWIHGDLHPGNLLVRDGSLSAVLDFGDLTAGDPATDLSVAWMLLPRQVRRTFRILTCDPGGWLDGDTWTRARAWALALGAAYLANAGANDRFASVAAATIREAILE